MQWSSATNYWTVKKQSKPLYIANEDFTSNIAEAFFKRNPNADTVSGWDGGVTFRFRSLREGKFRVNKDFSVDRDDQNTFNHFMDKSGNVREPGLRELTRS